jgi:hypothetical protein
MLYACLYTICFVFCYTSWRFYALFGTNLLTRCHSASSLFSVVFVFQKKLHRKYSWNCTKQKPNFLFFPTRDGVQSRDEGEPGARHTIGWRGLPLAHTTRWCGCLPPPDAALPPIYSPRRENPKAPDQFSMKSSVATAIIDPRSGGSRSSSRHPAGEGNHHRRPSSSPCLPSE